MMRSITAAIFGLALLGSADASLAASPSGAGWNGCYVGGNAASGWQGVALLNTKPIPPEDMGSHIATGAAGGLQAGCDLQTGAWVVGLVGLFDWTGISGTHIGLPGEDPFRERSHASSFAALTARAGYLWQPNFLLYAEGGAAWLNGSVDELYLGDSAATLYLADSSAVGWTVGGGAEFRFASHWSAFAEYDYADFGTKAANYTDGNNSFTYNVAQTLSTVLVGLNYRFSP